MSAQCRRDLAALSMPRSTSMQEILTGLSTLQPLLSAKPTAVHPAPSLEDGNKRNDYKYNNDEVDRATGPAM